MSFGGLFGDVVEAGLTGNVAALEDTLGNLGDEIVQTGVQAANANRNFNKAVEKMQEQCAAFGNKIPGDVCEACKDGKFSIECDKTVGPVDADFSLVIDPCQNNIQVNAEASVIGNTLPPIEYIWQAGGPLEKKLEKSFELKGFGMTGTLDMAVSNPTTNVINVKATADACISVRSDELLGSQKNTVIAACSGINLVGRRRGLFDDITETISDGLGDLVDKVPTDLDDVIEIGQDLVDTVGAAAEPLKKICELLLESETTPKCGSDLSGLFDASIPDVVKDVAENNLGIKDLSLPLDLVNENIDYQCVDSLGNEITVDLKTGNSRIGNPNEEALKELEEDGAYSFGASLAVAGSGLVAVFSL